MPLPQLPFGLKMTPGIQRTSAELAEWVKKCKKAGIPYGIIITADRGEDAISYTYIAAVINNAYNEG